MEDEELVEYLAIHFEANAQVIRQLVQGFVDVMGWDWEAPYVGGGEVSASLMDPFREFLEERGGKVELVLYENPVLAEQAHYWVITGPRDWTSTAVPTPIATE
jgi:hypothetical protein